MVAPSHTIPIAVSAIVQPIDFMLDILSPDRSANRSLHRTCVRYTAGPVARQEAARVRGIRGTGPSVRLTNLRMPALPGMCNWLIASVCTGLLSSPLASSCFAQATLPAAQTGPAPELAGRIVEDVRIFGN